MKKKLAVIISWSLVALWMILIFYLSSQVASESDKLSLGFTQVIVNIINGIFPGLDLGNIISNHLIRKSAHFFAYLILGLLVVNALDRSGFKGAKKAIFALAICVLYAISDEVHQLFVPGRSGQVKDVLIDSAGAVVGLGFYLFICKLRGSIRNR